MKKQDQLIGGILLGVVVMAVLGAIASNPRVPPLYRHYATTAEGEIFQHVVTGDLIRLIA